MSARQTVVCTRSAVVRYALDRDKDRSAYELFRGGDGVLTDAMCGCGITDAVEVARDLVASLATAVRRRCALITIVPIEPASNAGRNMMSPSTATTMIAAISQPKRLMSNNSEGYNISIPSASTALVSQIAGPL